MSQIKMPQPKMYQEPPKETLTTIVTDKSENATRQEKGYFSDNIKHISEQYN